MASKKYLDETGLQTLWNKIKTIFLTKEDAKSIANSLNSIKENVGLESGLTLPDEFSYNTIVEAINTIDDKVNTNTTTISDTNNSKQDKLIAGTNITISNNTISTNTSVVTGVTTSGTGNVITGYTKNNGLVTLGKAYAVTGVTVSGNGNAITTANVSNGQLTLEKGGTYANSTHTHSDGDITYNSYKSNGVTPLDMAISNLHSANRIAFGNPSGVIVEYSNNSGTTWVDYGLSNTQKINLTSGIGNSCHIGKKTTGITTSDMLRITLSSSAMGVYTACKKIFINFTSVGASGSKIKIERMMKGSTTWVNVGSWSLSGWSNWNTIPFDYAFGGGSTQTSNVDKIRLTLTITGTSTKYASNATIIDIAMFGETYWAYPSQMAKTGHLYEYDYNQGAKFPEKIYQNKTKQVVDTITYNGSTLTNNNGSVTIPTIERGNRWTCGTAMTGTSTTGTIFSGSGITDAIVGDMYLNTNTCCVYQCTLAGNASTAKWAYRCDIGQARLG